jgi:putative transposase
VRLRTEKTKGCLSRQTALTIVFRLCQCAEKKWRRLDGTEHLAEVIRGIRFVDGLKKMNEKQPQEQTAA